MKSTLVTVAFFLFFSCSDDGKIAEYQSKLDAANQSIESLQTKVKELEDLLAVSETTISEIKTSDSSFPELLYGFWTTGWPASSGLQEGYLFEEDGTFYYFKGFWGSSDISNETFPISNFVGITGIWKLEGTKISVQTEKIIFEEFESAVQSLDGYASENSTFKIDKPNDLIWYEIADTRSFRSRWVKSEDNYPAGKFDYPAGDPDIRTLNILPFTNGELTSDLSPYVEFGTSGSDEVRSIFERVQN